MLGFEVNENRYYDEDVIDFMRETMLQTQNANKSYIKQLNGRVPCYNGIPSANLFGPAYKKAKFQAQSSRLSSFILATVVGLTLLLHST